MEWRAAIEQPEEEGYYQIMCVNWVMPHPLADESFICKNKYYTDISYFKNGHWNGKLEFEIVAWNPVKLLEPWPDLRDDLRI